MKRSTLIWSASVAAVAIVITLFIFWKPGKSNSSAAVAKEIKHDTDSNTIAPPPPLVLDTALYNEKVAWITHGDSSGKWPVKGPYPKPGALLPFNRIIAFYGNLYSKGMGILGALPEDQMLAKLQGEMKKWKAADTTMNLIPALHYIAVTAQGYPGADKKYRLRMPFKEIDKVLAMAQKINAIVFLDVQVGFSTVQDEIPRLEKYLKMPNVHLGIDPEFSMKKDKKPGKQIGTYDAVDINYVSNYLAKLVKENNLPPKILVVHRFTRPMVTNYKEIKLQPDVQIVMDMDGWGGSYLKHSSYMSYIHNEPVQFTGFKLFYKNDALKPGTHMLTPEEVLKLKPQPIYIQYQ